MSMLGQHLKPLGFRKGCWNPQHEEDIDNYIEIEVAAGWGEILYFWAFQD